MNNFNAKILENVCGNFKILTRFGKSISSFFDATTMLSCEAKTTYHIVHVLRRAFKSELLMNLLEMWNISVEHKRRSKLFEVLRKQSQILCYGWTRQNKHTHRISSVAFKNFHKLWATFKFHQKVPSFQLNSKRCSKLVNGMRNGIYAQHRRIMRILKESSLPFSMRSLCQYTSG